MKIKCETNNERIDKYLALKISKSRALINKMIQKEFILVNGSPIRASYKLKIDDEIEILEGFVEEVDIIPEEMDIDIVFEDNDIIIVNKPSGLVVHPGSGTHSGTLVNGLMYYTNTLSDINGDNRLGIVHRIDKDTSGLLIVAKNNNAHNILAQMFKDKKIKREYIALLKGEFPHESCTVDAPIGRDKINRKKMTVTSDNSKEAITHLKVIKRYKDYTLVSLNLETGRTHQIRVHMNYIGYPVHNDPVYNTISTSDFGQFLHSTKLEFKHPITMSEIDLEIPLPTYFKEFIDTLEEI